MYLHVNVARAIYSQEAFVSGTQGSRRNIYELGPRWAKARLSTIASLALIVENATYRSVHECTNALARQASSWTMFRFPTLGCTQTYSLRHVYYLGIGLGAPGGGESESTERRERRDDGGDSRVSTTRADSSPPSSDFRFSSGTVGREDVRPAGWG